MKTISEMNSAGYFKVATFCGLSLTWKDGRKQFADESAALRSIKSPGRYRLSHVTDRGRIDLEPFDR